MLNEMMVGVLILIAGMLAVIAYEISQIHPTVNVCEVKPEKKTKKKTEKKPEKKVEEKVEEKVEKKPRKRSKTVDIPQKTVLYGEKWEKITDKVVLPDRYEVSNFGRVLDMKKGRLLRQSMHRDEVVVYLRNNSGNYVMKNVRYLVAKAFIGEQSVWTYKVVHIDGDPLNNNASNLKWQKIEKGGNR